MKNKYIYTLLGLVCSCQFASASYTASFAFTNIAGPGYSNTIYGYSNDASTAYLGPYTGTLNGATVGLYCDDWHDSVDTNTKFTATVSYVSDLTNATALSAVRFGASAGSVANGTKLYQEIAWLLTQESQVASKTAAANQTGTQWDAIQEAVWELTGTGTPLNSHASSTSGTAVNTSNVLNAYMWANAAALHIGDTSNQVVGGVTLYAANYSTWEVIDQQTSFTSGTQVQELLTQTTAGTQGNNPTPEPGTFALLGGALASVGFVKFRKARKA